MARLTMTMGLPASGKTTWAKGLVRSAGGHIKRANRDELRDMIDLGVWSPENELLITAVQHVIVTQAFAGGFDVVVDDTNFDPYVRENLVAAAKAGLAKHDPGAVLNVFVKDFTDVPIGLCKSRAAQRRSPFDETNWDEVIETMAARWGVQGRG